MSLTRSVLLFSLACITVFTAPRVAAAGYTFVEGYNVLDTNNAPIFATGDIGTNFAATAGQERDIAVDAKRGIIYIGRGLGTFSDGRAGVGAAISCIVVTNGARAGSNFRDTGVIAPASGEPTLGFCQSLAYDPDADKLWVFGGTAASITPIVMSAPGGTLGGAPDGDGISVTNGILVREFQADSSLGRGGAQRGFAVRTSEGVTTVFLGMGSHVQAWRNDQSTNGGASPWRRIWATLAPPTQNTVATRLAAAASAVNGLAVDDAGNCYFNVAGTTPARIWTVRPEIVESAADPLSLDFNDTYFGGTNNREILPLILTGSATATDTNNPQGITFCRFDAQKALFVSFLMSSVTTRGVTRLDIDEALSSTNGIQYLRAVVVDGFGSGQPAGGQDSILSTMRLKQAGVTQPSGAANALLFHDVDSVTNPTYLYVDAFVIDTTKSQTIPTAAIMKVQIAADTNPPSITVQPQPQTLLEGGTISLSVGAAGQKPLFYQWQSNSVDIPNATNSGLAITPASTNHSGGFYRVTVTNALGSVTSTQVQVTVNPLVRSTAMTPLWSLAPGSRHYLTTDNSQRGLTFNPELRSLLVVSKSPSNGIYSLDPNTGLDNNQFQLGPLVTGGTFALNMISTSDEGHIYAANLAENGQDFRIYYWDLESYDIDALLAYSGNPSGTVSNRWGDTLNVRGSGNDIQLIAASRRSNVVAIFTTTDTGFTLTPTVITVPDAPNGAFGLGVAFGAGNTFWGKGDQGTGLRLVQFDLANGTGMVLRTYGSAVYPASAIPIGVETTLNVLAAISVENPDNLRLYDLSNLASGPRLVDQELFASDNENINATGSIDFGDGKVFALDSNNGIIALTLGSIPPPPQPPGRIDIARNGGAVILTWTNTFTLQSATNVTGPYTDVTGATSGYSENTGSAAQKFFRLKN